jgi:hypothetical protein
VNLVVAAEDPKLTLARRLRALRLQCWPDLRITQQHLAEAFGEGGHPLSLSLISSWESAKNPVSPPVQRLYQYSIFFATRRSMEGGRARLLDPGKLTNAEREERDRIYDELCRFRNPDNVGSAEPESEPGPHVLPLAGSDDKIGDGPFYFADRKPVTLICSRLPEELQRLMPFTDPKDPDYVRSFAYADIDSVLEIYGHLRAVNPTVQVTIRTPEDLEEDDYTAHLVLLGGMDWNKATVDIIRRAKLPVRLGTRPDDDPYGGAYEVIAGKGAPRAFRPVLERDGDHVILREDLAYVFRGTNPYNRLRTLTLCNGMFGRGTYAAVRALTDARFRDRNANFLLEQFGDFESFSVLARVLITDMGETMTPDWTAPDNRLHVWPTADGN